MAIHGKWLLCDNVTTHEKEAASWSMKNHVHNKTNGKSQPNGHQRNDSLIFYGFIPQCISELMCPFGAHF